MGYLPFVAWNATHDWENFAFTFHTRQHFGVASARFMDVSTVRFVLYAALSRQSRGSSPYAGLSAYARRVDGAAAAGGTACVLVRHDHGIVLDHRPRRLSRARRGHHPRTHGRLYRRIVIAVLAIGTAYATATALFLTLPELTQAGIFFKHPELRGPLASGVYVFAPLAAAVQAIAAHDHDATILTDRYETAAELRWYGVDSRIVVALPQQPQWMRWHAGLPVPQHALLVTFAAPLDADPSLATRSWRRSTTSNRSPRSHSRMRASGKTSTTWCSSMALSRTPAPPSRLCRLVSKGHGLHPAQRKTKP